jgi:nicotinamide-nucleotide amidase
MKCTILSVGDELVTGRTIDTNSAWLSRELCARGCEVVAHATAGDDQPSIVAWMRVLAAQSDLLVCTGGIGPTPDDLTRQALAEAMGVQLIRNESWVAHMEQYFRERKREMPASNLIQAMLPDGSELVHNPLGTASGIRARLGNCRVVVLPGVPREMQRMFAETVLPAIRSPESGQVMLTRTLHTFSLGESVVASRIADLMQRGANPSVGTTVADGVVSVRIYSRGPESEARRLLQETEARLRERLSDVIYGVDEQTLQGVLVELMRQRGGFRVATAESCTGGLIAKMITDIPGSSEVFDSAFVTYSNRAKHARLGVSLDLIKVYGAVSEPVASAMAAGAVRLADVDAAVGVSGVAGPGGGTPAKPVGTVCIAVASKSPIPGEPGADDKQAWRSRRHDGIHVAARTFHFPGERDWVRDRSAKMALWMLRNLLLGQPVG